MPKKKKPAIEKTTEQVVRELFPKKVVEKLKEIAHEKDENEPESPSQE